MFIAAKTASILLAAASVAIGASPASAAELSETRTAVVRHGDLDLTSERGIGTLNSRISAAARAVCDGFYAPDVAAKQRVLACRKQARASASAKAELAVAAARKGEMMASTLTVGTSAF